MEKDGTLEGYLTILLHQAEVCSCRPSKTEKLQTLQKPVPVLYYLEVKKKLEECFL